MSPKFFTNYNGERIAYRTHGSPQNPPVILIHGWTSFMGVWDTTVPALQKTHHIVTLDLLGHGQSDKPHDGDYSIIAQAQRVLGLADMLGLHRFAVVGHSMGGQTAIALSACVAPHRVTDLVSVSGVVSGAISGGAKLIHQFYRLGRFVAFAAPLVAALRNNPHTANALYGHLWFENLYSLPRSIWRDQAEWAFDTPGITPLWKAGNGILSGDFSEALTNIQARTMVIFGDADATVPTTELNVMQSRMEPLTARLYDGCGHFPMFEQPDTFQTDLTAFLAA